MKYHDPLKKILAQTRPYWDQKEEISPDVVAVLNALQQQEARQAGSVAVRFGRHKRTVIFLARDLLPELHSQKELKLT